MLWLIEDGPVEPVDLHALIEPVSYGVDVDRTQRFERQAAVPQYPEAIRALEARTKQHEQTRNGGGPRALDEMPHEPIQECDECEPDRERIDQEDVVEPDGVAGGPVLG